MKPANPWYRVLYVQVLLAIALGVAIGFLYPAMGAATSRLVTGLFSSSR